MDALLASHLIVLALGPGTSRRLPAAPSSTTACWNANHLPHVNRFVAAIRSALHTVAGSVPASPLGVTYTQLGYVPLFGVGAGMGGSFLSRAALGAQFDALALFGAALEPAVTPWLRPDGTVTLPPSMSGGASRQRPLFYPRVAFILANGTARLPRLVDASMQALAPLPSSPLSLTACTPYPFTLSSCAAALPWLAPAACGLMLQHFVNAGLVSRRDGGIAVSPRHPKWEPEVTQAVDTYLRWSAKAAEAEGDARRGTHPCLADAVSLAFTNGTRVPPAAGREELVVCIRAAVTHALMRMYGEGPVCGDAAPAAVAFLLESPGLMRRPP